MLGELTPHTAPPAAPRRWPLVLGIVSVAMLVGVLVVLSPWDRARGQWLQDQWVVLTQPSPAEIVAIADATGMSEEGRLIFLASTPEIDDAEQFNQACRVESEGTLGCFDGTDIYIYAVTDPRLQGTIEVTAAHEMLHAAYARLQPDERERVDRLVEEAVAAIPLDDPVFRIMEGYPADQRPDEWHSRLGTAFGDLPAGLEAHYARYFDDRSLVIALEERSTALLDELQARISDLSARADELDAEITARTEAYNGALARYEADVDAFNQRVDDDGFDDPAEYDAARSALLARQRDLEAEQEALNALIDEYNDVVAELTALDADYADLYQSLDSTSGPSAG